MKIYLSHKREGDFKAELYEPLRKLSAEFIFPHENSDEPFDSKSLFTNKQCDVVLAEVSQPSIGQGIELGWANNYGIKIICIYKKGLKISNSLKQVSSTFIEYSDHTDLTDKLTMILKTV